MMCVGAPRLEANDLQELTEQSWKARFKNVAKLGQGGFADVLCVKEGPNQLSALKVLRLTNTTCFSPTECAVAGRCSHAPMQAPEVSLFREARALKHAQHEHVVKLHSVVHVPQSCVSGGSTSSSKRRHTGMCWGLMLECLQGGSLQQQVYKAMCSPNSQTYSFIDALTWAVDVASAVAHLHSLDPIIIHRDMKLENILLLPQPQPDAQGRKLPVAKLTDFGLHVMIERPPGPFFITTGEDGMPMLILNPDVEQQQQLDTDQVQATEQDQVALIESTPGTAAGLATLVEPKEPNPDDKAALADATPQVAHVKTLKVKSPAPATPKGAVQSSTPRNSDGKLRHVAFSGQPCPAADAGKSRPTVARNSPGLVSNDVAAVSQQQQQQPGWKRLTSGTLRRLSIDSAHSSIVSRNGPSGSSQTVIPLLIDTQGQQSGSFVNAAVPCATLLQLDEQEGSETGAADEILVVTQQEGGGGGSNNSSHHEAATAEGAKEGDVESMLAAANSQRDYEVHLRTAALTARRGMRRGSVNGSTAASCCSHSCSDAASGALPAVPAEAAARSQQDEAVTPRAASSSNLSLKSGDWPTAASMMWEDLMDNDAEQTLLLDGTVPPVGCGHGGPLVELPLSYNLTGHTGSFMYMAPEVFKRKPYNQSVDVFGMGVMMYELFARTLLIYTHTPANSPADCEHYAKRISEGYRPRQPKSMPTQIWALIEACWDQDPSARPSAANVLKKLQTLLQQAQAAEAAKPAGRFKHMFAGKRAAEPSTNDAAVVVHSQGSDDKAAAQAPSTQDGSCRSGAVSAEVIARETKDSKLGSSPSPAAGEACCKVGPASSQPAKAEPSCGCVIC